MTVGGFNRFMGLVSETGKWLNETINEENRKRFLDEDKTLEPKATIPLARLADMYECLREYGELIEDAKVVIK